MSTSGPLPLPIEHGASSYGEEAEIQRDIQSAAQYNPATKLGITAGDQPSKPKTSIPTTAQAIQAAVGSGTAPGKPVTPPVAPVISAPQKPGGSSPKREGGFGPSSGLSKPSPPFANSAVAMEYRSLAQRPDATNEIKWYGSQVNST